MQLFKGSAARRRPPQRPRPLRLRHWPPTTPATSSTRRSRPASSASGGCRRGSGRRRQGHLLATSRDGAAERRPAAAGAAGSRRGRPRPRWALGRSVAFDARLGARTTWPGRAPHADELYRIGVAGRRRARGRCSRRWRAIGEELAAGTFRYDDGDEDVHGALERRLLELSARRGAKLHAGRSRNDQVVLGPAPLPARRRPPSVVAGVRALQGALADRPRRSPAPWRRATPTCSARSR